MLVCFNYTFSHLICPFYIISLPNKIINKFENNKFEINKSENNKSEKVYYYQINKLPALKKYVLKHYYQNYRQLIKIILLLLLTYTIISYLIIFPDW